MLYNFGVSVFAQTVGKGTERQTQVPGSLGLIAIMHREGLPQDESVKLLKREAVGGELEVVPIYLGGWLIVGKRCIIIPHHIKVRRAQFLIVIHQHHPLYSILQFAYVARPNMLYQQ